ncbi:Signal transduction histidine kinase [Mesobacillus persicus]|uniref:histidine kinase n=1 Tax=Mesobacillus persicus TaxID=930146 RepID=A0A1H7W0I5_9BACI|nr:HAMP domain-containing sensor histidine kinase [Mesobacillus persicus]SEM14993.1 Signal transduction histidine kinase [Mesobacillus persicus]
MKRKLKINSISVKLGILFSGIFIALFFILGSILYGAFTHLFIDYIKQDLVVRANNHANVLGQHFHHETISHVVKMETDVTTNVLIADSEQKVLDSSIEPDKDMNDHMLPVGQKHSGGLLEEDWREHDYLISVSPIGNHEGYVYMYYPTSILREIVFVMNIVLIVTGLGVVLLALGLIGFMSRMLTQPLITMKEATNKMALGKYKQRIPVSGDDEVAQLGESIQSLGEQLQDFEDSRNEFLATVSHELRTPLTYIKGYSDILNKGIVKKQEEQVEYLKIINKEANRITFLVNDLFDMSKFEVGKFELNKELASINPIIKKVVSNLKPEADEKGLILTASLSEVTYISIDSQRMEQAIYNLVENAIKYTNEGKVTVKTYQKNELIVIEVEDTGIGIPTNHLSSIWERFYRVDKSRTRKTGGSGLGLYVVKNIIQSHNGDIRVESTEDKGSTFTIHLN